MTSATTSLPGRLKACRGVLVDSNVLLDVATNDPNWGDWSARALAEVAEHTSLVINPIVYAEVSIGYSTIEALDAAIPAALYRREALPWEAGFLAERCFVQYRRRGGPRHLHLPDFYKGAHAAVGRLALLTRDAAWYRRYFPGVEIIAPSTPTPARRPGSSQTSPRAR